VIIEARTKATYRPRELAIARPHRRAGVKRTAVTVTVAASAASLNLTIPDRGSRKRPFLQSGDDCNVGVENGDFYRTVR
jgi:hypothetical protein